MNKSSYLALSEVKDFIEWLSALLNSDIPESFVHGYLIEPRGRASSRKQWRCSTIYNAFEQSEWRFSFKDCYTGENKQGSSYSESEAELNYLREKLIAAVKSGDNNSCFNVCSMILKWGGVLGSRNRGNEKILHEMREYLASYLKKVKVFFEGKCELSSRYQIKLEIGKVDIVMNAGFTKIYSLLCDEFIIYDGRVGAALGCLVVSFLNSPMGERCKAIPAGLDFYYGNAKNPKVNRNPSVGNYQFKALSTSYPVHIRNNLKANWIISALNLKDSKGFSSSILPTRSFESALFMIGYRV